MAFLIACGRLGHVFDTSANPRPCKKKAAMSPFVTVRGGAYDTKVYKIRIDGASGICGREFLSARINQEIETREIGPTFPWGLKQLENTLD